MEHSVFFDETELQQVRQQFPLLARQVHGKPLVYLDNAATTQKPQVVIDALVNYYTQHNANVHRGVHTLGDESTTAFLQAHQTVAEFFGAQSEELILTSNTTEALNLLALGLVERQLSAGDVIIGSMLDHHSNFVPWQQVALRTGAQFLAVPVLDNGLLDEHELEWLITKHKNRLKVVALPHVSNALGTVVPVQTVAEMLRAAGVRSQVLFVLDAAQSAAHLPLNFAKMDVDALAFSGHKLYGPMGVGGLLVKKKHLENMQPVLWGGGMIDQVSVQKTTFAENLIDRYTAGTPDVAGVVGLAAACTFLAKIGWEKIQAHEHSLLQYAYQQLQTVSGLRLVGPAVTDDILSRVGSISWIFEGVHSHDVAQILDRYGVAVRSGHHCTMPLHTSQNWIATTRASFALYNTKAEIDSLVAALHAVKKVFSV